MAVQTLTGFLAIILNGLRMTLLSVGSLPFRVKFVLVYFVATLWLFFNISAFATPDAALQLRGLYTVYLVSVAFVFALAPFRNPLAGMSTGRFLITFTLWVIISAIVFKAVQPFAPEQAEFTSTSLLILATHALVVAISEELLFRVAIPSLIPAPPMVAQIISAVIFGVMHYAAYGGSWAAMGFATALGIVFGAFTVWRREDGIVIAMAAHFAWNSYALGYITLGGP